MAYATRAQLEARIPVVGGETAFSPLSTTQVDEVLDGVAAEIDGVLASLGLTTPVTAPAALLSLVTSLNVWGAAAEVRRARFQDKGGPNAETAWRFFEDRYRKGLDELSDRAVAIASGYVLPSSYTVANPDEDNDLGDNAEPWPFPSALEW